MYVRIINVQTGTHNAEALRCCVGLRDTASSQPENESMSYVWVPVCTFIIRTYMLRFAEFQ